MINNLTKIEVKIGERIYQLLCAVDSPLGEVHDALSSMKGFIVQKIQELDKSETKVEKEDNQNGRGNE